MTGLFYIMIALGIVFAVWAYANEEKLIKFEDRLYLKISRRLKKNPSEKAVAPSGKNAQFSAVKKQPRKTPRRPFSTDMPRTAA